MERKDILGRNDYLGERREEITMKNMKSSAKDLREIFERNITSRHIAESFCSFDGLTDAKTTRDFMESRDFDVVGVRQNGQIIGYVVREDCAKGKLLDFLKEFKSHEILLNTSSLLDALEVLYNHGRVFILSFGKVAGIITRGDLQKIPVRMWLFGLISLIEMQLLRLIRERFPKDSWIELISRGRISKAKKLFKARKQRNEAIDLADCLQLCDKRQIVVKSKELIEKLELSKKKIESLLKELEELRDRLAHAQDVITGNWPDIINLTISAEEFLKKCESIEEHF